MKYLSVLLILLLVIAAFASHQLVTGRGMPTPESSGAGRPVESGDPGVLRAGDADPGGKGPLGSPMFSYESDLPEKYQPIRMVDGWRFRPGDHLSWKNPSLNDDSWERVNLFDEHRFEYWEGTGWFRKTLVIKQERGNRAYILSMKSSSAAQVYIDGKLIYTREPDPEHQRGYSESLRHPAYSVHLIPGVHQVAVRIEREEIPRKYDLMDPTRFVPFISELVPYTTAVKRFERIQVFLGFHLLAFGLTLAIGAYHLIIWRLTRLHTRIDLYFGAFSLTVALRVLLPLIEVQFDQYAWFGVFEMISHLAELAMILGLIHVYQEIVGKQDHGPLYLMIAVWIVFESTKRLLGVDLVLFNYLIGLAILTRITIRAQLARLAGWRTLYIITALMLTLITATYLFSRQINGTPLLVNMMITLMMMIPYILIAGRMARLQAFSLIRLHDQLRDNERLREEAVERERLLNMREIQQLQLKAEFNNERLQAVQQTAAGLAHELNTPLAVAGLGADMILLEAEGSEQNPATKRHALRIRESVERMGEMIKHLLNISQVETKEYVDGVSVLDLQKSTQPSVEEEENDGIEPDIQLTKVNGS